MGDADDETGSEGRGSRKPVLADHERRGKRFIPPFLHHLGGMTDVRWIDRQAPELVWIALLLEAHGLGAGAEAALAAARALRDSRPEALGIRASDYDGLDSQECSEVGKAMEADPHGEQMVSGVRPLGALYPTFPMKGLLPDVGEPRPGDANTVERVLSTLTNRWSREATLVQGTVIYIAMVCGSLKMMRVPGFNLRSLTEFPRTEESKITAGIVRTSTSSLLGRAPTGSPPNWPAEFWSRGFDLAPCSFGGSK